MYKAYFGLKEAPFSIAPDPQFLYLSRRDREALAHFQYGISVSGGFVQLTGEVGTGKTLLIRSLLEELPDDVDLALILNPVVTVHEFVAAICDELQVAYRDADSLKGLVDALNAFLLGNHARGRRTVLVMDEAQNLSLEVLEQVRLLTNLETSKDKLLQILLVGQPELEEKLAAKSIRQLAQRITVRYRLEGFGRAETIEYVDHRCRVAGAQRRLFTPGAIRWVHRLTHGNPRMINIVCDRALMGAYSRGDTVVTASTLRRAAAEVGYSVPGRYWLKVYHWSPVALGVMAAATVALWLLRPVPAPVVVPAAVTAAPAGAAPRAVPAAAATPAATPLATLGEVLADDVNASDTETAFRTLFARWGLNDVRLGDRTACDVAAEAGLRCIFDTGTWNNLRSYNRPTVIELVGRGGRRHHVVINALDDDTVWLAFGAHEYAFPVTDVDNYWYGKYLLLWRPPLPESDTLSVGARGDAVLWVRDVLARYRGQPLSPQASDVFDVELESDVKEFQRRHKLVADGIVGQRTLIQLNNYSIDYAPPTLRQQGRSRTG